MSNNDTIERNKDIPQILYSGDGDLWFLQNFLRMYSNGYSHVCKGKYKVRAWSSSEEAISEAESMAKRRTCTIPLITIIDTAKLKEPMPNAEELGYRRIEIVPGSFLPVRYDPAQIVRNAAKTHFKHTKREYGLNLLEQLEQLALQITSQSEEHLKEQLDIVLLNLFHKPFTYTEEGR